MPDDQAPAPSHTPPTIPPPKCLNREQVACLKTALALVIVKRRYEERQREQRTNTHHTAVTDAASLRLSFSTPLTPSSTPAVHWAAHLDHMMGVAVKAIGDAPRRAAVATHVALQLTTLVVEHESHVEEWMHSYLVVLQPETTAVWEAIVRAKPLGPSVAAILLDLLGDLLHRRLQGEASLADDFGLLHLWSATLSVADRATAQACLDKLTDYSVEEDPAVVFLRYTRFGNASQLLMLHWGLLICLQNLVQSLAEPMDESQDE